MKRVISLAVMAIAAVGVLYAQSEAKQELEDIFIRDPYILPVEKDNIYYMYATSTTIGADGEKIGGVKVYKSKDLQHWSDPVQVCVIPESNWSRGVVWAPEVHLFQGKYYLFATINSGVEWKAEKKDWPKYTWRATQIFRADSPEGPFVPLSTESSTPSDQMALDGTLYVEDGVPYGWKMVSHI